MFGEKKKKEKEGRKKRKKRKKEEVQREKGRRGWTKKRESRVTERMPREFKLPRSDVRSVPQIYMRSSYQCRLRAPERPEI